MGEGEIAAEKVGVYYEHFVTLAIRPTQVKRLFVQLSAAAGRCPDDYYAV